MLISRRRRVMSWRRVGKSVQALVAHALLFSFTLLLSLKLQRALPYSWWFVFFFSLLLCFFYVSNYYWHCFQSGCWRSGIRKSLLESIWVLKDWFFFFFFCLRGLVQSLYIRCFEEGITYKCCEIDWNTCGCV